MSRIALLSDIHMQNDHVQVIREGLERAVARFEEVDPAHLFVMGDLIEDGDSAATDVENVRRVRDVLQGCSFPVTYMLGNHDVENLSRDELGELLGQDSFYGLEAFDEGAVLYLDSSIEETSGARGRLGPTQREWLDERLVETSAPVVLVHHPIGNFDISDNHWFSDHPERAFLGDRKEVLAIFEANGTVGATVSGHIHQTGFTRFRGVPHVSVNAFGKELPDVPFTGTYATLDLAPEREIHVDSPQDEPVSFSLD